MQNCNGYGSIIKNGGNRKRPFQVRLTAGWTDEGKQIFRTLGWYETQKEAKEALTAYHKNPLDLEKSQMTFKEVFDLWTKKHYPDISQSTINTYNSTIKYCKDLFDVRINKIRIIHLQDIIDNCPKYSVRENIRTTLNLMYKFAAKNEIVGSEFKNLDLEVGKSVKIYKKVPFSDDEVQTLFDNVGKIPYIESIIILCFTGCRVTEFLELKTENVHITNGDRYMIGGKKTQAGKNRVIPINKKILKFIENYYNPGNEYLFTIDGKSVSYNQYRRTIFKPIMRELNMNHNPHECRHFAATKLDEVGTDGNQIPIPRVIIKRILGHLEYTGGDVTNRYSHTTIQQLVDAIDKI